MRVAGEHSWANNPLVSDSLPPGWLPGRATPLAVPARHYVTGGPLAPPYPPGSQLATFGLGCFWGAERMFWQMRGVVSTAAGYCGGSTPNPTYEEVCTGRTGHAEVVRVAFDPARLSYEHLLRAFWESHDPTQGARQGNDVGTQYRSCIFFHDAAQCRAAEASRSEYASRLAAAGYGPITTEILAEAPFYHAEEYQQQYLAKNPAGYCGLRGTGVACPLTPVGV